MPERSDRAALIKRARECFQQAQEAEKDQRKRELEDLRFYAGDQWPIEVRRLRDGHDTSGGLPAVPARPCLTITGKAREPVRQVLNQERQSEMGIEIVPADDFGELVGPIDDTEIQLREGLVRRIQRESQAADARTWAFSRATIAGRGFYGVMTRYVPGKTNDQEIYIHRFYNQASVSLDPAHEQPDGSDAEWALIATPMPWKEYKKTFKKRNGQRNRVSSETDWRALGDEQPEWFTTEGDMRMMLIVDFWYTELTERILVTYQNVVGEERSEWADEIDAMDGRSKEARAFHAAWQEVDRRATVERAVKWCKLDASDDDVLEETDWPGPDLPIVKVVGEELHPYDKQRRVEGMIRPMREPIQGYNYMISRWVEVVGLAPLTPVMMAEGQDEGFEREWDGMNTRTLGRVHYKQKDLEGNPAPPPTVPPARNPPIQEVAASVQVFDEAIQASSMVHDPSLGKVDPSVKSGRAIKALQEQSARGTNHFLDNLQRSIRYEGQIINNLLYPIYGRLGRVARIINGDGEAETVLLHTPMVVQNGKPVPVPQTHPDAKQYTLTKDAKFNVIVKVSKNFDSRREQEAAIVGDLLSQNPALMTWFGDLFFKNLDGPGHQLMADRAKVMLDPKILQAQAAQAQSNLPPEVQAQLQQAQQMIQQLQQQLQQAAAPGAVAHIKVEGEKEIKGAELQFQREKLERESETKLAVAELGAKVDRLTLFLEERARLGIEAFKADQAAHDRAHDTAVTAMKHAHALEKTAVDSDLAMQKAEHQQAIAPPLPPKQETP